MFLAGYQPQDLVLKPAFLADVRTHLARLAAACAEGPAVGIGLPVVEHGVALQRLCGALRGAMRSGSPTSTTCRTTTSSTSCASTARGRSRGRSGVGPLRIGTPICEDGWFEDVTEAMAETGAEILLVPNGSPYHRDKFDTRLNLMVARVVETGLPLAYLNMVGGQDDQAFDGGSFVLEPRRRAGGAAAGLRRGDRACGFRGGAARLARRSLASGWGTRMLWEQDYRAMVEALRDYVAKSGFAQGAAGVVRRG